MLFQTYNPDFHADVFFMLYFSYINKKNFSSKLTSHGIENVEKQFNV